MKEFLETLHRIDQHEETIEDARMVRDCKDKSIIESYKGNLVHRMIHNFDVNFAEYNVKAQEELLRKLRMFGDSSLKEHHEKFKYAWESTQIHQRQLNLMAKIMKYLLALGGIGLVYEAVKALIW